jgi:hypothetical protein
MNSKVRRTSRPTLEALEGRLVPSFSWGEVNSPDLAAALTSFQWGIGRGISSDVLSGWDIKTGAAVLTAAQPAPALSSFQWGVGRGTDNAAVLTARKAGGDPTAVSRAVPPGPTTVVTAAPSIILKRVGGDALPTESISLTYGSLLLMADIGNPDTSFS